MMKELMDNQIFLWIILPLIVSFGITLSSRYCGRDDEECENCDQRIQLWIYILFSTILVLPVPNNLFSYSPVHCF